jgi:translin
MSLNNIFSELTEYLDKLDKSREEILKISREIIRDCSIAIKNSHRSEDQDFNEKIYQVKTKHEELIRLINEDPGTFFKYLKVPEQEFVEAIVLNSITQDNSFPSPKELNVNPLHYALGLTDVIGELRRYILDNISNSKIQDLRRILDIMDEIYTYLFSVDYPSGLTQDLRHKTDIARNIIEKTRGDVSITLQMHELKNCIEGNIQQKKNFNKSNNKI